MFNLLINFCLFVFIFYAVWGSARAILFGTRRKRKHARAGAYNRPANVRAARRKKAKITKLNFVTAKQPQRKKSSAAALCA